LPLNKLISIGVGMTTESSPSGNKLEGKKFAFTGALSISRKEVEKIIENNGGEVYSIKKGLDILILGENGKQEKADKAKKHGAEVISEEEFLNMLK
jgi:DNA ligase (NAD+)